MTEADQSADGKGEVRPSPGNNQNLEDRIAYEKDAKLVSDNPEERKRHS
jgi:hypothetical protein